MQDIIKLVTEKTGLSESKAQEVVQMALGFVKDKLPAGVGSQLDSFIGSKGESNEKSDSTMGNILGGVSSLFGGKK